MTLRLLRPVGLVAAVAGLCACVGGGSEVRAAERGERPVVETARILGGCEQFAEAVTRSGLSDLLNGPGPFTVFVPSDAAFLSLRADRRRRGLLDNPVRLEAVLRGHIVTEQLNAPSLVVRSSVRTLQETEVDVEIDRGQVLVGSARVLRGDYRCSNGVVHVIDAVLLP